MVSIEKTLFYRGKNALKIAEISTLDLLSIIWFQMKSYYSDNLSNNTSTELSNIHSLSLYNQYAFCPL